VHIANICVEEATKTVIKEEDLALLTAALTVNFDGSRP